MKILLRSKEKRSAENETKSTSEKEIIIVVKLGNLFSSKISSQICLEANNSSSIFSILTDTCNFIVFI